MHTLTRPQSNYSQILETPRLRLRPLSLADLDRVYSWASQEEVAKYMSWPMHRDIDDTRAFLNSTKPGQDFGVELKSQGLLIGSIGIYPKEYGVAEIGWCLHPDYHQQGYGTECAQALVKYGFEDLKLHRLFAPCVALNYPSYRVMENAGMQREGVLRQSFWSEQKQVYWDMLLYAILAPDYFASQAGENSVSQVD
ncbi:MAG: GNAT family N-acetyltransferase [Eubacteriales bacterium]|nr:GNAT family N-acetyltransferase [Eubacteriales bacterium]